MTDTSPISWARDASRRTDVRSALLGGKLADRVDVVPLFFELGQRPVHRRAGDGENAGFFAAAAVPIWGR